MALQKYPSMSEAKKQLLKMPDASSLNRLSPLLRKAMEEFKKRSAKVV